jgi:hypothetical protein
VHPTTDSAARIQTSCSAKCPEPAPASLTVEAAGAGYMTNARQGAPDSAPRHRWPIVDAAVCDEFAENPGVLGGADLTAGQTAVKSLAW